MHITVQQILSSTPIWVWILLVVLIKMGMNTSQERPVNLPKMFLAPLIFMIWGLWTITTTFSQLGLTMTSYIIFIIPGIFIGYSLNKQFQAFYKKDSIVYKKQSYLPLMVVLLNFIVKYVLNVMLIFYHNTFFHIVYSSVNGLTVGLFFGEIIYTYLVKLKYSKLM